VSESFDADIEFQKLRAGRDDIDLVQAMLEVASDAYPALDTSIALVELDRLAGRVGDALLESIHDGSLRGQLQVVSRVLHHDEAFLGDLDNYYDPRNSYLNDVLDRRRGIPITLSIVYQAVANRAGLPVYGVGAPGHYIVGCQGTDETLYVDPFALGEVLTFDACRHRIEKNLGQPGVLTFEHFQPSTPQETIARVLRNLKGAYAQQNNWPQLLKVQRRLTWLLDDEPDEHRDLALVYLRVGEGHRALNLLTKYVESCSEENRTALEPFIKAARRMIAELN